jgi:hypothetical protein
VLLTKTRWLLLALSTLLDLSLGSPRPTIPGALDDHGHALAPRSLKKFARTLRKHQRELLK